MNDKLQTIHISELTETETHKNSDFLVVTDGETLDTTKETIGNFTGNLVTLAGEQEITGKKTFRGGVNLGDNATVGGNQTETGQRESVASLGFVLDNFAKIEHYHDAQEISDIDKRILDVTEPRYAKYNHHHDLGQIDNLTQLDERYSEKNHTHTTNEIIDFAKGVENVIGNKFTPPSHGSGYQDITGFDERVAELTNGKFAPISHTHKCDDIVDLWETINGKVKRLYAKISHAHNVNDITDLCDTINSITTDLNGCIEDIKELKDKHAHNVNDITDLCDTINSITTDLNGCIEDIKELKDKHAHNVNDITDLCDTINSITTDLNGCIEDIKELKDKQNSASRLPFQNFTKYTNASYEWTAPADGLCTVSVSVQKGGGKKQYCLKMQRPNTNSVVVARGLGTDYYDNSASLWSTSFTTFVQKDTKFTVIQEDKGIALENDEIESFDIVLWS